MTRLDMRMFLSQNSVWFWDYYCHCKIVNEMTQLFAQGWIAPIWGMVLPIWLWPIIRLWQIRRGNKSWSEELGETNSFKVSSQTAISKFCRNKVHTWRTTTNRSMQKSSQSGNKEIETSKNEMASYKNLVFFLTNWQLHFFYKFSGNSCITCIPVSVNIYFPVLNTGKYVFTDTGSKRKMYILSFPKSMLSEAYICHPLHPSLH